jgi:hypothetical protein
MMRVFWEGVLDLDDHDTPLLLEFGYGARFSDWIYAERLFSLMYQYNMRSPFSMSCSQ